MTVGLIVRDAAYWAKRVAAADRDLRLSGYDVYRFGATELISPIGPIIVGEFFERLFRAHRLSILS